MGLDALAVTRSIIETLHANKCTFCDVLQQSQQDQIVIIRLQLK